MVYDAMIPWKELLFLLLEDLGSNPAAAYHLTSLKFSFLLCKMWDLGLMASGVLSNSMAMISQAPKVAYSISGQLFSFQGK